MYSDITYDLQELPACCFPDSIEQTYDRSFHTFAQSVANGKICDIKIYETYGSRFDNIVCMMHFNILNSLLLILFT